MAREETIAVRARDTIIETWTGGFAVILKGTVGRCLLSPIPTDRRSHRAVGTEVVVWWRTAGVYNADEGGQQVSDYEWEGSPTLIEAV